MVSGVAISVGRTGGRQWEPGPEKTGYLFDMASNVLGDYGWTWTYSNQNSTERICFFCIYLCLWYMRYGY